MQTAARRTLRVARAFGPAPLSTQSAATEVGCVVVGAGVVGLAIARALAPHLDTLVVDQHNAIGMETSSRNSEVIHAGIYYPRGSLKASLCVEGKNLLYDYCASRGVPHARLGKLLVASSEAQVPKLHALEASARANGVEDLTWLSAAEAKRLEPVVKASGALLSPSSGIVDSHAYMKALQADLEGGYVSLSTRVVSGEVDPSRGGRFHLRLADTGSGEGLTVSARVLVNAAGLHAQAVSAAVQGIPRESIPRQHLARGVYFTLRGPSPFRRLVYPVPEDGGLGTHATLDLGGGCRFGPDVEWVDGIDYAVDPKRGAKFEAAIRTYWPALPVGALQPGYAGIRSKLSGPGEPPADFAIQGPADHGVPHLLCLYGIESPGLTASLAIAREATEKLAASL